MGKFHEIGWIEIAAQLIMFVCLPQLLQEHLHSPKIIFGRLDTGTYKLCCVKNWKKSETSSKTYKQMKSSLFIVRNWCNKRYSVPFNL